MCLYICTFHPKVTKKCSILICFKLNFLSTLVQGQHLSAIIWMGSDMLGLKHEWMVTERNCIVSSWGNLVVWYMTYWTTPKVNKATLQAYLFVPQQLAFWLPFPKATFACQLHRTISQVWRQSILTQDKGSYCAISLTPIPFFWAYLLRADVTSLQHPGHMPNCKVQVRGRAMLWR